MMLAIASLASDGAVASTFPRLARTLAEPLSDPGPSLHNALPAGLEPAHTV